MNKVDCLLWKLEIWRKYEITKLEFPNEGIKFRGSRELSGRREKKKENERGREIVTS